ncbi:MAG: hypothetical protein GEV07_30060 [Streptosporangiales bacterium]|nr:hypothetical protein [Streptosporangiales bacterium]
MAGTPLVVLATMHDLSPQHWAGTLVFGAAWGGGRHIRGRFAETQALRAADRQEFPVVARQVQAMSTPDLRTRVLADVADGRGVGQLQQERQEQASRELFGGGAGRRDRASWSMTHRVTDRFTRSATPYAVVATALPPAYALSMSPLEAAGLTAAGLAAGAVGKATGRRAVQNERREADPLSVPAMGAEHRQLALLRRLPRQGLERVALDLDAASVRAPRTGRQARARDDHRHGRDNDGGRPR